MPATKHARRTFVTVHAVDHDWFAYRRQFAGIPRPHNRRAVCRVHAAVLQCSRLIAHGQLHPIRRIGRSRSWTWRFWHVHVRTARCRRSRSRRRFVHGRTVRFARAWRPFPLLRRQTAFGVAPFRRGFRTCARFVRYVARAGANVRSDIFGVRDLCYLWCAVFRDARFGLRQLRLIESRLAQDAVELRCRAGCSTVLNYLVCAPYCIRFVGIATRYGSSFRCRRRRAITGAGTAARIRILRSGAGILRIRCRR